MNFNKYLFFGSSSSSSLQTRPQNHFQDFLRKHYFLLGFLCHLQNCFQTDSSHYQQRLANFVLTFYQRVIYFPLTQNAGGYSEVAAKSIRKRWFVHKICIVWVSERTFVVKILLNVADVELTRGSSSLNCITATQAERRSGIFNTFCFVGQQLNLMDRNFRDIVTLIFYSNIKSYKRRFQ